VEIMSNDFYRIKDGTVAEGRIVSATSSLFAQIS
jgi:hypothetical protein